MHGTEPKPVTLVLPYYENPRMLARQLENLAGFDGVTRARMRLIVVDDASPRQPARIPACAVPFKLYRCGVDVRWNWIFCRNLAVSEAETEWVLLTDIDHLLPPESARALVCDRHDAERAYLFSRVSLPGLARCKPHANSWLMTRTLFDEVGGYDERFSGYYGSDFDFRKRVRARARVSVLPEVLIRVPNSEVVDASTMAFPRVSAPHRLASVVRQRGTGKALRLTFPWARVQ